MTGRLFRRLGLYPGVLSPNAVGGLPPNETTIATQLKTVGYTTGGLGKCNSPVSHLADLRQGTLATMTASRLLMALISTLEPQ